MQEVLVRPQFRIYSRMDPSYPPEHYDEVAPVRPGERGDLYGSLLPSGLHAPMLDLDYDALLKPVPGTLRQRLFLLRPARESRFWKAHSVLADLGLAVPRSIHPAPSVHRRLVAPVFEFQVPVRLLPSRSSGHHHFFIERAVPWRGCERLLVALRKAGLVDPRWADRSLDFRMMYLRTHDGAP